MLKKKVLLGVEITSEKTKTILENVIDVIHEGKQKLFIVTPNPEMIVYSQAHPSFKATLNKADVALADGVGILIASRLLGLGINERTTGVDFIEKLCKERREKPLSMGFLGGRRGVAELAAECLKQKYPWIEVGFVGEEWTDSKVKFDILFVAYGFPKQEEWIQKNLEKLPVRAAIGVGGAFDFLSGQVPRAPMVFRRIGLEWLFRLFVQPWRIKRQLALFTFMGLVIKEIVHKK